MGKSKKFFMGFSHFVMAVSFLLLLYIAHGYVNPGPQVESVKYINNVTIQIGENAPQNYILPCSFQNLPPRTAVTITATIYPEADEEIYVQSYYSPGKVYLGDSFGYEFGKDGQYPPFMLDPAPEVHMLETHGTGEAMELRMEFFSPKTQRRMILKPALLGTTKEIILQRFQIYGPTCILAAAQILYGFSLLLICLFTRIIDKKSIFFLWLGLLSLTAGMWAFGENHFSGVICKNSTMLYLSAFGGFFTFIIPLLRFTRSIVDYENPQPIWYLELFMAFAAALALALQLLGMVACSTSTHFFYIALPASLVFLTGYTVREYLKYRSVSAGRFILPIGILTITALLGLVSYLFSITYTVAALTQLGMITFLLLMGVNASLSLKDSIHLQDKKKQLDFEKKLMEIQAKEQKNHSDLLNGQAQLLSQQRHDMRHHLNVMKSLAGEDHPQITEYLDSLIESIPSAQKIYCENQAVNAIISHYVAICQEKQIDLNLDLTIPDQNTHISDSSLCVIFGNLLENAVEACDRIECKPKFIRLHSRIQYELLAITMDNSFNGTVKKEGERFRSSKRNDFGIGLSSILTAARKAGGNATFRNDRDVFYSSVYVNL